MIEGFGAVFRGKLSALFWQHGWTRSYTNLAGKYGFDFHVSNGAINKGGHGGSRSIAGEFGARASPLLPYLDERHYDVRFAPEEWQRVTLWTDCNSEFYGSHENTPPRRPATNWFG